MNRNEKLCDELSRSVLGDPWHGASLKIILDGITFEHVFHKPISNAHNIIELTLHITAWTKEVNSRFLGNEPALPQMGDWPEPQNTTEEYWNSVKQDLFDSTNELITSINKFPEDKLDEVIGVERLAHLGTGFSFGNLIYGLVQHNAYHGGQIAILNKSFEAVTN